MTRPHSLIAALLLLLLLPGAASAQQTVTRGSTLQGTPFAGNEGNDCDAYWSIDTNGNPAAVNNPWGATSCTYFQGFVFGNADTDARTGFVPSNGTITSVTVKVGANPAPLRFVILRQLTNAQGGGVAGEPKCCFFVSETQTVQPAPNTTSTFPVNLKVENNRQPNVITQDAIGFSAPSTLRADGQFRTLPLARTPNFSSSTYTPNEVTSSSFHPALNAQQHGVGTGGAIAGGQQSGLDVLLQYTFTPDPTVVAPGGGTGPLNLQPTDITTIGGNVLRPIGGALDVVLDCKQAACAGSLNLLTRNRVTAAAAARKKKIRSLGTTAFTLGQGPGQKVRLKLNKLGRKLARKGSTKVRVVVDFGGTVGSMSKNLTLKKATKKR